MRNLKLILIDEVSMMKCEQLYQLDLRMQEVMVMVMERPRVPFGGVRNPKVYNKDYLDQRL